ncbi:MAG: putative transcriptional regulator of pyridoxine metabolism [Candidatus Ozemobacter sibiricus]|jgi:DNA-binding transcriptional regulator YhcF (GntR family)|uniref:Putative transcriptional regulator of pyridoxine metabolism n=1 Tax=Candidatus Ozemobacter sibiricus TaxID=2268124 RepID=A0A367ZUL2_9BACT|nr:MAG: putative transcriptional regulator of pyridoxine metabolism [Candidatus Ozemobacter sibiricus]
MPRLPIAIDPTDKLPVYRQVVDQITQLIRSGKLAPGDRLPPERDLAAALGVARGTIKQAYDTLVQQRLVVATQGRGSFVAGLARPEPSDRRQRAVSDILELICRLEEMRFTHREIANLFTALLAQREELTSRLSIAIVDCNPEALAIYHHQIALLSHLQVKEHLLGSLAAADRPAGILASYDLIVTTLNHHEELCRLVPDLADRLVPVAVSPSSATLIALGRIPTGRPIGALYQSERFCGIIEHWLRRFGLTDPLHGFALPDPQSRPDAPSSRPADDDAVEAFDRFLRGLATLIVPPGYALQLPGRFMGALQRFRENGGLLVHFDYQIDPGSLLHLEERLKLLLQHPIIDGRKTA